MRAMSKLPSTLSQYLRLKAKEYKLSEQKLSQLIIPGSSGSLIACIRHNEKKLSEKKIHRIASFFKENPMMLTFMAGKIPKGIHDMIISNKELQIFLIEILEKAKTKGEPNVK
jgi:hypothetical protein